MRKDKERQGKMRKDKERQGKTRKDKERQGKMRKDKERQGKTRKNKTRTDKDRQEKTTKEKKGKDRKEEEGRGASSQFPGVAQGTVVRPPAGVPPFPCRHTLRERVTSRGQILFRDGHCHFGKDRKGQTEKLLRMVSCVGGSPEDAVWAATAAVFQKSTLPLLLSSWARVTPPDLVLVKSKGS